MMQNKFLPTQILMGFLIILGIGLGFNYFFKPLWTKSDLNSDPTANMARQGLEGASGLANGLTSNLTTEQAISQLLVLPIFPTSTGAIPPEVKAWLEIYQPGFIQIRSIRNISKSADIKPISYENVDNVTQELATLTKKFVWPSILMANFSGGLTELNGEGFATIPTMKTLCANPDKAEPAIASAAAQLKKLGISIVIGPVIDINQQGAGVKGLCGDAQKIVVGSRKFIENFGAEGILPILAHFPGTGRASLNPVTQPQTLAITVSELKPFQQLLEIYPNLGVLVSPLRVAEKFNDQPCSQSKECLATFPKQFPDVVIFAEGVDGLGARAITKTISSSNSGSIATSSAAMVESGNIKASDSATAKAKLASQTAQISIAESARLSLLAGANVLMFDSTITPDELTDTIKQLTTWATTDPELKTAIDASWKKVLTLRSGQNN